jgi:hypothetical protein
LGLRSNALLFGGVGPDSGEQFRMAIIDGIPATACFEAYGMN